jgi:O-antigen/teichoic acid export membrane protein
MGNEKLHQKAYLNSITATLDYGAKIATGFFVNPILVNGLGSMLFGVWQMLGQISTYTDLADTRATQVLKWTVANKRNSAARDELRSDVTSTLIITLVIMPILLLIGGIISWYSPYIIGVSDNYNNLIRTACAILILSIIINKLFHIFESILRGMNLGYKRMGIRASLIIIGGLLKITVIFLGYGLIGLSIVQVFISIITGATLYIIVKNNVVWFGFGKSDYSRFKKYAILSGWFIMATGANLLLIGSDMIILGYLAGPTTVTVYAITRFSSATIQGIVMNIVSGVIPGIGGIIGNKDFIKARYIRSQIIITSWYLITSVGIVILIFNNSFITLWIGQEYFAGQTETLLIIMMVFQFMLIQIDAAIINVTLELRMRVLLSFIAALVSIMLSIVLVNNYGILGLCAGIIIGRMILTIGYPSIVKRHFSDKSNNYLLEYVRLLAMSLLLWLISAYVGSFVKIDNWVIFIGWGAGTIIISFIICWYLTLTSTRRENIISVYRSIRLMKSE